LPAGCKALARAVAVLGEGAQLPEVAGLAGLSDDSAAKALAALCRALGAREADCGTAGLKDRQAVTRQWVSVPAAALAAVTVPASAEWEPPPARHPATP